MKTCIKCKEKLPLNKFYDSRLASAKDGKNRYCIQCCKVNRGVEAVRRRDKRVKISRRQIHRCIGLGTGMAVDTTVNLADLFKRDRGICAICGLWVQPRHASIDHEPPVSRGGTHTWEGVQLTHLKCNLRKSNN